MSEENKELEVSKEEFNEFSIDQKIDLIENQIHNLNIKINGHGYSGGELIGSLMM